MLSIIAYDDCREEAEQVVEQGRVFDRVTGETFAYEPMPFVLPVSERLMLASNDEKYQKLVTDATCRFDFALTVADHAV